MLESLSFLALLEETAEDVVEIPACDNRELQKTTMATGTSLNKGFNEQNNGRARAL